MVNANQIEIKNVKKQFSSLQPTILSDINLTITSGEFISMLGPSGCGKSTLLRMMAQLEKPTSGSIVLNHKSNDVGFVFQDSHLLPWRNVFENVCLPLEINNAVNTQVVEDALHKLDIADAKNKLPHELSGGMKMRVSIARALVKKPKVLFLDEPFAALDEIIRLKLSEEMRKLWETDKMTIVFVTHSISEACFLSDRIVLLSSQPAVICHDLKINLPQKRDSSLRMSVEFNTEKEKIYKLIKELKNEK